MRLFAFRSGGETIDRATLDPFDESVGTKIAIPYFFFLIEHPEGYVLFDTGAHRDFIDDPRRLGAAAEYWQIAMQPDDHVEAKLQMLGLEPDRVDHVALSHLHYDHSGGVALFPHAAVYVQLDELTFAHYPPVYQRDIYVRWTYQNVINWKELHGDYDLFNDGRVVLFQTPGHTPGHQSMLVRTDNGAFVLAGDAIYDIGKMRRRTLPGVVWNADKMIESWERIEEEERKHGATILISHELKWQEEFQLAPTKWYG